MKKKGGRSQRESMICGQFITRLVRKINLLSEAVLIELSALTYCRALDMITLRELKGLNGRLITKTLMPGAPRVAMPIPPRPSMQDLYDKMCNMEIRQGVVERMDYRQSYQWDMYAEVFEHMVGVYDIPLHGAYNQPGYDQE
nr:hypothetical protein [Tanacetum cinerariifolium]